MVDINIKFRCTSCNSNETSIIDSGEYSQDSEQFADCSIWYENECSDCGAIFFIDIK